VQLTTGKQLQRDSLFTPLHHYSKSTHLNVSGLLHISRNLVGK